MSSPHTPGSDAELRALLEQIAATAGDPPEHGLDRVATLRRRRTRHRRRAVATTMALAVSGVASVTWLNLGQRDHDLSVGSESDVGRWPVEQPDVLEVHCNPDGIDIPVATIQAQSDGLHVEAINEGSSRSVEVRVVAEPNAWDSGPITVEAGEDEEFVQPVRPGPLTVGCKPVPGAASADTPTHNDDAEDEGEDEGERRQVILIDTEEVYTRPALSCPADESSPVEGDLPARAEETNSFILVVEEALDDYWNGEIDEVAELEAYPDQDFPYPVEQLEVQVLRNDETVALVKLDGAGPWTEVAGVRACDEFLVDPESEDADSEGSVEDGTETDEAGDNHGPM